MIIILYLYFQYFKLYLNTLLDTLLYLYVCIILNKTIMLDSKHNFYSSSYQSSEVIRVRDKSIFLRLDFYFLLGSMAHRLMAHSLWPIDNVSSL